MKHRLSFIIGVVILTIVAVLTIAGTALAPRNPLERSVVSKTDDGYHAPPYPISTPGYILGSDQYGRDILSRIMAGTQPTMLTIIVVATFRLMISTLFGLLRQFSPASVALIVGVFIRAITYLPQLFGALLVVVLAGTSPQLGVFIIALVWSGWGDVAQIISQRTAEFRQQLVYDAAVSGGATQQSILVRHVRRHLAPLWGMLWLREMSNSLALLAMLGFLGYFVGGAQWVIVAGDAVPIGARTSDIPELGQLLATSFERVLEPQAMFMVGGYIALVLLGFNLLGDGLRTRMSYLPRATRVGLWQQVVFASEWWASRLPRWQIILFCVVISAVAIAPFVSFSGRSASMTLPKTADHIWQLNTTWRDARADAGGSFRGPPLAVPRTVDTLPTPPEELASVVISNRAGDLVGYSTTPGLLIFEQRTERWSEYPLKFMPVGNPTLTNDEEIVVVGAQGFIAEYDFDGIQRSSYIVKTRAIATAGATVDNDGNVYVTVVDRVESFDHSGEWRWVSPKVMLFGEHQAQISPDGDSVILGSEVFDAADGARLPLFAAPTSTEFENPLIISGADGYLYQRISHRVRQLDVQNFTPTTIAELGWNANQVTMFFPERSGVTAHGIGWMVYKGFGGIGRFVWLIPNQEAIQIPIYTSMNVMFVADEGQYPTDELFRAYVAKTTGRDDAEIDAIIAKKHELRERIPANINRVIELSRNAHIPIATHDDDSEAKVLDWVERGIGISEFPTTMVAATSAHQHGMLVGMGAPNVLRGKSSGGNISATEAIKAGYVDWLCSDYYPAAMLPAAFKLADAGIVSLSDAINMITYNPARAVGIENEYGAIHIGAHADLIVVRHHQHTPLVERVFVGGKQVFHIQPK